VDGEWGKVKLGIGAEFRTWAAAEQAAAESEQACEQNKNKDVFNLHRDDAPR